MSIQLIGYQDNLAVGVPVTVTKELNYYYFKHTMRFNMLHGHLSSCNNATVDSICGLNLVDDSDYILSSSKQHHS